VLFINEKENPLFHCTKFGEELEYKVYFGSPLGYPFKKKMNDKKTKRKC